jgi:hypothetical protein
MTKSAHLEAAERHEKSATSHRSAAEQIEKGDQAAASRHAEEAHGLSTKAHAASGQASAKAK